MPAWSSCISQSDKLYVWRGVQGKTAREGAPNGDLRVDIAALVTLFGASTLLLTLAGLYARVAYAVAQRAKECAVRQAVGATPARVIWLLTSRIVAGAAIGLALGAATLPALATTIAHMAFEVSITDGPRVLGVALAVGVAAAAACYLPARGVRTMNLAQVIRSE